MEWGFYLLCIPLMTNQILSRQKKEGLLQQKTINIRVIAIANAFWMTGKGLGGGDRRAIEILKRFKEKGIDGTIVTSKMGYTNYKEYININYITIPFSSLDKLGLPIAYLGRSVVACFLKLDLRHGDILYSTSDFLPDVFPAFMYKSRNKTLKWIQIVHHLIPDPSRRTGSFFTNLLSFFAQRVSFFFMKALVDLVIVVSPLLKKELEKLGFDERIVKVNGNGINVDYFKAIRKCGEMKFAAVFLGRLHSSKGIFDLIKIWERVCKEMSNAKLGIIGDGDDQVKHQLRSKIVEKNLRNNIDVLQYLKDDEAFKIIKSSKLFVFPSYEEGWGISICEAMACGIPVVAWNLPVYSLLFSKAITSVPVGDVAKFAIEVLRLLNDRQLYERMEKEAVKVSSKYSWHKVAEEELRLITN